MSRPVVDPEFVPARAPGVVAVDTDAEAVLVDERTRVLHVLNPTAALLWECFDGSSSIGEIGADLAADLGAPAEVILGDAARAVEALQRLGVLYDARGPAPADHGDGEPGTPLPDQSLAVPRPDRLLEEPPNA